MKQDMKIFLRLILCAVAFIAIVSCKKDRTGEPVGPSETDVTWTVGFESFSTKAALGDGSAVGWSGDEAISVFSGKKNQMLEQESTDGNTAVFSGKVISADTYHILYPYDASASGSGDNITSTLPERQALVAGSFDPAAMLAVARTAGGEIELKNMVALLAIRYKGDVKSMTVSGASENDRLAGKVRMNTGTGRATVVTGSRSVSLEGNLSSGSTYYVAVLPGTVSGLVVTAMNKDGLSAEIAIETESVTLERNTVLEYEADFSEVDWILRPPVGQSYDIKGADELAEFCAFVPNPKEEVVDLSISGDDITDDMLAKVKDRVSTVLGDIVWNNVGATSTEGFFDRIECRKGITIKDCRSLVALSGLDAYTSLAGGLVISGCPVLGQGFNALETVSGSLKLEDTGVMFGEGKSFAALTSVGGNFEVVDCSDGFTSFRGASLSAIGGDINITGNTGLTSLEGIDRLTSIGGNVIIMDNGAIPVVSDGSSVGFCIVREYINKNIISSTATIRLGTSAQPVDISGLPSCDGTKPGDPQNYVLNGKAEVDAFVNAGITNETVNNLTVTGDDIDSATLRSIIKRVSTVKGTLTLENLGYTNADNWGCGTDGFLEFLTHNGVFDGSIVMRNIAGNAMNPNGFINMEEVKGSIIIENCPGFCMHWTNVKNEDYQGLANIRKIGGDMKFINSALNSWYNGGAWAHLEHVGGDFVLEGLPHLYFMQDMKNLTYIGGELVIKDCTSFWGLNGFENLTWLGGNVLISNYGKLQLKNGVVDDNDCRGLCLLRDLMDNRIMNQSATVTIVKDDNVIDFSTVKSCSVTDEADKNGGNEKYPEPDPVEGWE